MNDKKMVTMPRIMPTTIRTSNSDPIVLESDGIVSSDFIIYRKNEAFQEDERDPRYTWEELVELADKILAHPNTQVVRNYQYTLCRGCQDYYYIKKGSQALAQQLCNKCYYAKQLKEGKL